MAWKKENKPAQFLLSITAAYGDDWAALKTSAVEQGRPVSELVREAISDKVGAGEPRRALVLHAMRSDAEFNPARLSSGTGAIYSRYKRLGDNVMDENYFPILWREDGYRTPAIERYVAGT